MIIMNIIVVLLCFLVNPTKSGYNRNRISPAKILAQQKIISENSDLYVTCSTFGLKKSTEVFVYLCKDDSVMNEMKQKQDQYDTTFIIKRVSTQYSGNYSCVFSVTPYSPSRVTSRGHNTIQILVIANFLPADISLSGPSTVGEGDDAELTCTFSNTLQTLGECDLIHSYLMKNHTILQVQAFNVKQMEATFTVKGAVMRDSGHYSCVVLPSKCIREDEETIGGNNSVFLEVKENMYLKLIFSLATISVILCIGLCLWVINQRGFPLRRYSCSRSAPANAAVLEQQQQQNQEENAETHYDSVCEEEEEDSGSSWYQNVQVEDDFSSIACEQVYTALEDLPPPSVDPSLYATTSRPGKENLVHTFFTPS